MSGQVYNMKGILRGVNLDPSNGLPEGLSIERMKDGQPSGDVKFFSSGDIGAAWGAIKESLKSLHKDQQIDYQTSNYKPIAVGAAGTLNKGKGGGGYGQPRSPEERMSIVLQSIFKSTSELYVECLKCQKPPTQKTFHEAMDEVWNETEIIVDKIHAKCKGVQ
jgi:hypothetical protein